MIAGKRCAIREYDVVKCSGYSANTFDAMFFHRMNGKIILRAETI